MKYICERPLYFDEMFDGTSKLLNNEQTDMFDGTSKLLNNEQTICLMEHHNY